MTIQHKTQRREFIQTAMAGCVLLSVPLSTTFASASNTKPSNNQPSNNGNKKVVWIMLRGAMDSLHAVIPSFDKNYFAYRTSSINSIKDELLPLDDGYALHPAFKHLHQLYRKKQFSAVVAVATSYRERSHFDAQDHMESGLDEIDHENGWLARAIQQYQGQSLAISRTIPIALRSNKGDTANTWYPSSFKPADEDLLDRLAGLYEKDDELSGLLQKAVEQRDNPNMMSEGKKRPKFTLLANRCGEILSNDPNIKCAMLELGGWDTHNNQAGRLQRQFSLLDDGIKSLQEGLGKAWDDTLVLVTTEFGRTVALNGTSGTDHGTASCLFMLGGNIRQGGEVLGKWPGLAVDDLFEKRDLMPTSDVRTWISKGLQQHWGLSKQQSNAIFPDLKLR
jgi:uncharacterized protein (DUF1501 family)